MFYGVRPAVAHLWAQAKAEGRDWYYLDNAYFDACRETQFRVTKNAVMHDGSGVSDGARFAALGLRIDPWRSPGLRVVVCPSSDEYMRVVAGWTQDWAAFVIDRLQTRRQIVVRHKRDRRPLTEDLRDAWAVVTHTSCAAIEALLAGVPVFVTGEHPAATLGKRDLTAIEAPLRAFHGARRQLMEVLADHQWTTEEIASGAAWQRLAA